MIPFYVYDTATGRVLTLGKYDERGDGASARTLKVGAIDPVLEYAPNGVKTARPRLTLMSIDKTTVAADGVEAVTVTQVPNGATVAIYRGGSAIPRAARVISDGTLVVTFDTAGSYRIVVNLFPNVETTYVVSAQ